MTNQLSLFDLQAFQWQQPVYDPTWDDTQDPPDPDDYPTLQEYETAWNEWEQKFPELIAHVQGMSVLEQVTPNTQQASNNDNHVLEQASTDTAPEHKHWVEQYKVVRCGKEHYYYRYLWMSGRKLHHVHIPGGNVRSPLAIERKEMVENAIAAKLSPVQIEKLIKMRSHNRS
ncbi:hypothetical protein [Halotia branconii]|uniref:Uncharacterized protein n=1 Tax=Halotia branconii CENA392 TaxID=1539056 RepID=A0AAJ6NMX1_9CYAN|nr:hypothetical protein [Halotia branconii]WGV23362.1 hypothetical protein QI031_16170 [Halotia branconii CENA392]